MLNKIKLLFILILTAASIITNVQAQSRPVWIPEDFDPRTGILLIQSYPKNARSDRKMEQYIAQHYPYKYEIVERPDIKSDDIEKYKDTKIYHFALLWDVQPEERRTNNTGRPSSNSPFSKGIDFIGQFYDRDTQKTYPNSTVPDQFIRRPAYEYVINTITKIFH